MRDAGRSRPDDFEMYGGEDQGNQRLRTHIFGSADFPDLWDQEKLEMFLIKSLSTDHSAVP